jgi:hypothetical protein
MSCEFPQSSRTVLCEIIQLSKAITRVAQDSLRKCSWVSTKCANCFGFGWLSVSQSLTGDDTWVSSAIAENNGQSKQLLQFPESVFWDRKGALVVEFMQNGLVV